MSIIKSFDEALDFNPSGSIKSGLSHFASRVALYWHAMGDGLDAAADYQVLRARGVPHDTAVRQIFGIHFDGN